jgi:hypothetical protein
MVLKLQLRLTELNHSLAEFSAKSLRSIPKYISDSITYIFINDKNLGQCAASRF